MTWLTDTYYLFVRPGHGLDRVVDRCHLGGAALTVLVVGAILGIQAAGALGLPLVAGVLLGLILAMAGWFVGGTIWYATTGIVGGDGLWRTVLTGLGWASVPLVLLPVTATLGRWLGPTWGSVLSLAVITWMVVLTVRAVCRAAGLTTGQSLAALALVGLLFSLLPLSGGMLVLIGLAS
ncbi:MAG: hypothetical protein H7338_23660 [Candidatus Sericytochromatia bacterium]|nr:hypothetical protein [Candidatus Sericytochromatia bacterium]